MELIIRERDQIGNIEFNYDELKKDLADKLVKYKGTTYDDSAIALAKKDRAALNSLKKSIDDRKKEIKNECLAPYNDFEIKVKEILSMIEQPVLEIDAQIKDYEERTKADKKAGIEAYFNKNVNELSNILSFKTVFVDKWLNATVTMKSIKAEIDETIARVNADLEVIKSLNSEFDTELNNEYLSTFDLSAVLRKKNMLEERKKALDELEEKKKAQLEEKKALEAEALANETVQTDTTNATSKGNTKGNIKCSMGGCPKGKDICCVDCEELKSCIGPCDSIANNCGYKVYEAEEGQTELQIFENKYLQVFKQVADITKTKKDLEEQEKKVKEQLEIAMDEHNIDSIDNQYLKIIRVKASTTTSVDLKKLEEKETKLYEELLADYPKVTNKKSYLMFKVK